MVTEQPMQVIRVSVVREGLYLQAAITMVPEAWEKDQHMNVEKKAFYNWSAMAMEPWDGPGWFYKLMHFKAVFLFIK